MRRLAVAVVLLVPSLSLAETFEIKLRKRGKGDFVAVTYEEKTSNSVTVSSPEGKVIDQQNQEVVEAARYKEEILEKEEGKKPTKLRRTYDKAALTIDGKEQPFEYSGKAVNIQRLTSGYVFGLDDGKPLVGKAAGTLLKEFGIQKSGAETIYAAVLPKKAVAVNDTWPIDAPAVLKEVAGESAGQAFDLAKAKGTGKLTKAYKKDDKQFGVMEVELTAPLTALPGTAFKCRAGAMFSMKLTLDTCIDGTAEAGTLKGEVKFSGTADVAATAKDGERVMKFEMLSVRTDTQEPLKK
ncbi:MAG TPA: hypothetical protein VM597_22580 [Gemmataceae bacterium]|nr:hypothetical protein [Gemmataceae bacterium]